MKTALDLKKGETGSIIAFTDIAYANKLATMGLLPQSQITMIRRSPLGKCLYLKTNDQCIAIRVKEAACIQIEH